MTCKIITDRELCMLCLVASENYSDLLMCFDRAELLSSALHWQMSARTRMYVNVYRKLKVTKDGPSSAIRFKSVWQLAEFSGTQALSLKRLMPPNHNAAKNGKRTRVKCVITQVPNLCHICHFPACTLLGFWKYCAGSGRAGEGLPEVLAQWEARSHSEHLVRSDHAVILLLEAWDCEASRVTPEGSMQRDRCFTSPGKVLPLLWHKHHALLSCLNLFPSVCLAVSLS